MNGELEAQRDFLLVSLDDLERERAAGDIAEDDYRALKDDYTARAATVLRAIEEHRPAPAPAGSGKRSKRTIVVAVAALVAAAGAGLAVATAAGSRLPGDTITGDIRETSTNRQAEAVALAQEGRVAEALELYDEVVADDPENVRALMDRGLLLLRAGQAADSERLLLAGQASVEQALAVRPGDPEALFYLALSQRLQGDVEGATATLRTALGNDPAPALRAQIEDALRRAGQG